MLQKLFMWAEKCIHLNALKAESIDYNYYYYYYYYYYYFLNHN